MLYRSILYLVSPNIAQVLNYAPHQNQAGPSPESGLLGAITPNSVAGTASSNVAEERRAGLQLRAKVETQCPDDRSLSRAFPSEQ
jgi:hypothetical protein